MKNKSMPKNNIKSKLIKFVYDQFCKFNSKEKLFIKQLEEDITMSQVLETYISLQANNYPYTTMLLKKRYYAAQKIIFDIPNNVTVNNKQQFKAHIRQLSINCKLLNEELGHLNFLCFNPIHQI
ncbi:hypothetical protein RFI_32336 [Reticulomyxa filosa]|uniref:Uncharacterized protein n=1 Tax=Reticulomyxa filosa TaxID=46433 RepID=X6LWF9_RETFI|nr:hypothetical protein RFI_32336 [Reticulomyxa filosa]|eukprot:ETO05060.1 hypothetical protein RFI_32336 [Reticulomyxa filosa]